MSDSQPSSSSQPTGRAGSCPTCHRNDIKLTSTGELHKHGPRSAPCPGAGLVNSSRLTLTQTSSSRNRSLYINDPPPTPSTSTSNVQNHSETSASLDENESLVSLKELLEPLQSIIKWIPRGSRRVCADLLTH